MVLLLHLILTIFSQLPCFLPLQFHCLVLQILTLPFENPNFLCLMQQVSLMQQVLRVPQKCHARKYSNSERISPNGGSIVSLQLQNRQILCLTLKKIWSAPRIKRSSGMFIKESFRTGMPSRIVNTQTGHIGILKDISKGTTSEG